MIENIYQLIEMGRKVEDREVKDEVDKWVEEMNKFIVFRSIP